MSHTTCMDENHKKQLHACMCTDTIGVPADPGRRGKYSAPLLLSIYTSCRPYVTALWSPVSWSTILQRRQYDPDSLSDPTQPGKSV